MSGKTRRRLGTGVLKCHLFSGSLDTAIWDPEAVPPPRPCLSVVKLEFFMLGDRLVDVTDFLLLSNLTICPGKTLIKIIQLRGFPLGDKSVVVDLLETRTKRRIG